MKNYTDKELADFMLDMRKRGGRTQWRYIQADRWRWLSFIGLIVLLLVVGVLMKSLLFCGFVVGMVFGIFSRDGVWLRQQGAAWPFYVKTTDWSKVEKIANGETLA
ncbi:MAG TPA: hypothetical protein VN887_12000 [Candidatus Angelobacter sp.]|nr:hypothetical protein [Candidatus Angelobacter sp.]